MKQKISFLSILCLPLLLLAQSFDFAQNDKGIKWANGLSWQQVKEKAKKENKFIFVDCFATWCKPCKEMDVKVYTVDSVSDFLNNGFISVKLQMDATKNDDTFVKSWYRIANEMGSQYRIFAYPSYLFFSPNGEVVSKEVGYKDPGSFIRAARNATDPSKQYFILLKKYKQGKLDHAGTVSLIKMAQQIGDTADYRQILNSYYAYLHKQKREKLYTRENIEFVTSTLDRSSQVLFDMFYPNGKEVNRVMQNGWYAKKVVDKIIFEEKVVPFLGLKNIGEIEMGGANPEERPDPDWNALFRTVAKDYKGDYADRIVLETKIRWYFYYNNDNHMKFARAMSDKMEKYGSDTTSRGEDFILNNMANIIWVDLGATASPNKEIITELSRVAAWMEGVVRRGATATGFRLEQWPMYIDTYANLLHKIGRTTEAIKWEEFALLKCKEFRGSKEDLEGYEDKLNKMRKNEATWPIKN